MFLLSLGFLSSPASPLNRTFNSTSNSNSSTVSAAPGINKQINFQGKLVNPNGTNVTNGSYSIVFSIYTVSTAGTAVWTETQNPTVTDGIFQVQLGSVTSLPGSVDFNTDNIYLGIKVGADTEMTPRIRFGSVPQAFNAEKLGGLDSSGFIQNGTSQQTSSNFNISGNGTAGTSFTTPLLQSAAATALNITGNAASTWSTTAGNITIQAGSGTVSLGTSTNLTANGALTINATNAALALQTTTSGNITATTAAATGLVNVLTGNLKVGNGTPTITLNGEDGYIEGTFEVDGNTDLAGTVTIGGTGTALTISGAATIAINISNTGVTTDINLQNAETINNNTDGDITFTRSDVNSDSISIRPATGAVGFAGVLTSIDLTAARIWTLPNAGGTFAVSASGNIALSALGDITFTGTLPVANGGTGQTTLQAAINSLSGLTTEGDLLFRNATNSTRLARGTNGQCLTSNTTTILWGACGTGAASSGIAGAMQFSDGAGGFSSDATNFFWDNTNKRLGIGTATPSDALHVVTSVATVGVFDRNVNTVGSDANITFRLRDSVNNPENYASIQGIIISNSNTAENGALAFSTRFQGGALTRRMIIEHNGEVGIGIIDPASMLHVVGQSGIIVEDPDSAGSIELRNNISTPAANTAVGRLDFAGNDSNNVIGTYAQIQGFVETNNATVENGYLVFSTTTLGATTEKMRLTSAGSLGIGTNNPGDTRLYIKQAVQDTNRGIIVEDSASSNSIRIYVGAGNAGNILLPGNFQIGAQTATATNGLLAAGYDLRLKSFNTSAIGNIIFEMGNSEIARFDNAGNLGLGTSTPYAKLDVNGGARFNGNVIQVGNGVNALGDQESMIPNAGFEVNDDGTTNVADNWIFTQNVATATASVTTTSPAQGERSTQMTMSAATSEGDFTSACIPVSSGQQYASGIRIRGAASVNDALDTYMDTYTTKSNCENRTSVTTINGTVNSPISTGWGGTGSNFTVGSTATWLRVRIRLGSANLATTIYIDSVRLTLAASTAGIDIAENFPVETGQNLNSGEVVSLGSVAPAGGSYVTRSNGAYDSKAMGVVTTKPGLTLDDGESYEKVAVALTGRVPVKVNTENGAIAVGDPITASSIPGVGMKATQAGRIIGTAVTALEADESGQGTITVLINPEFYAPPMSDTLQAGSATFGSLQAGSITTTSLNVTGTATINTLIVLTDATIEGKLVVKGDVEVANLYINGKLISKGKVPVNALGSAFAHILGASVANSGTDMAGTVTINSGDGNNMTGVLAEITFTEAYAQIPKIVISGNNAKSAKLGAYVVRTETGFQIVTDDPIALNTIYEFDYVIVQTENVSTNN